MSARLMDKRRPDGSFPFEYRNSSSTDVRETWKRAREELAKQQPNVRPIIQTKRKANV